MTDDDIDRIYKSSLPVSHFAGLRAVYDAGYFDSASANVDPVSGDVSQGTTAPAADVQVQTP